MEESQKMWGGRFDESPTDLVRRYTASEHFDRRLYKQDILGSKAHVRMLGKQGILTPEETEKLLQGLEAVKEEIESGKFVWKSELEDVHMNIEARLSEIVGEVGRKLHTGRSRNDQVALDFRLYISERMEAWAELLTRLVGVLTDLAEEHLEKILPGFTHLQPAQPVSLGQHLMAYAQMFRRDFKRAASCLKRVKISPLGAAALAGTTYNLDPEFIAKELGFKDPFENSMDAVSDRDFVLEALFVAAMIMTHLSRICEEIIIFANPAFGFIILPDAYATGSSIMPQKKNPDVAEIMRGKTGRVYGALVGLLTTMKALPLAYNRDMQEDKEPFFDADETVSASLEIMAGMLKAILFDPERMRQALKAGFINATELADYLANLGMPFRDAHHAAGQAVALAEARGVGLEDLGLEDFREKVSPLINGDVYNVLDPVTALQRRSTKGGTSVKSITKQIRRMRKWLEKAERSKPVRIEEREPGKDG